MAISSGETVDPPNRQTDSQENDDAQDGEPERQVAGPAGCQFHCSFPPVAPEPSFRTLPHRQERLNAQTWPLHQSNSSARLTAERPNCPSRAWGATGGFAAALPSAPRHTKNEPRAMAKPSLARSEPKGSVMSLGRGGRHDARHPDDEVEAYLRK